MLKAYFLLQTSLVDYSLCFEYLLSFRQVISQDYHATANVLITAHAKNPVAVAHQAPISRNPLNN